MKIRKSTSKIIFGFALALISTIFVSQAAGAVDSLGTVTQYYTGWDYRNAYTILQDHGGNIWFGRDVEATKSLVKYVPSTNTYTDWTPNSPVLSLANGTDGNVWFTSGSKFGKVDSIGTKTEYSIPTEVRSSQTVSFQSQAITTGPDGRVWVLDQSSQGDLGMRLYNSEGVLYKRYSLTSVPGSSSNYEVLHTLAVDPVEGRAWYTYRNHNTSRSVIGYIDSQGAQQAYTLPTSINDNVSDIAVGSDGNTWYSGGAYYGYIEPNGVLGSTLYTPSGLSGGAAQLATGLDGRLWGTHTMDIALAGTTLTNFSSPYVYQSFTGPGMYYTGSMPLGITAGNDGNMWFTLYANYRIGKIGTGVSGSLIDEDGDGLTLNREQQQGTSDKVADTDGDGLSDFIESQWNPDQNDVFCGSTECAYPHPTQKDIYVQLDWMVDGSYSMKPSQSQIDEVIQAYADKGINLVFDTGQYGGGNQVTHHSPIWFGAVSGEYDFVDYKVGGDGISSNFSSDRDGVWHYMISGDHWKYIEDSTTITTSSGVANVSGPNLFIAYKRVDDMIAPIFGDLDTAVSGTIIHELGHNLCLTSSPHDDPACSYDGVDIDDTLHVYDNYRSAMNYTYQFSLTDYSQGYNDVTYDHDDWSALRLADFTLQGAQAFGQSKTKNNNLNQKNKRAKQFKNAVASDKVYEFKRKVE